MTLPLHERAQSADAAALVRLTTGAGGRGTDSLFELVAAGQAAGSTLQVDAALIPGRSLEADEQYRFHFNMTKCIGCRSCEIACNEQNNNPAEIHWRRFGEVEGGAWPDTQRSYLSMGCNHCLDAACLKGCPVDAYTKDPATGIVLHSADACIGCQYCVWNCPYSVPQFNPERGVVGKCDMCHGRLADGLEPACVNACPESAIEIEIVNMSAWREDYATAESPGMPAAGHTISTTRITLPQSTAKLEHVDLGHAHREHAHLSLVVMTTLVQSVSGALIYELVQNNVAWTSLAAELLITSIALAVSAMHLGRPAYAWRALKMWRRSWVSREVLLYTIFFSTLAVSTALYGAAAIRDTRLAALIGRASAPQLSLRPEFLTGLGWTAAIAAIGGTICSACIYLVPARPSWNLIHTPLDFLLSTAFLGSLIASPLHVVANRLAEMAGSHWISTSRDPTTSAAQPVIAFAALWIVNQVVRCGRLRFSRVYERRASASLLRTESLRAVLFASFAMVGLAACFAVARLNILAALTGLAGVFMARYLFFVSVVPLNMALTFVRGGRN